MTPAACLTTYFPVSPLFSTGTSSMRLSQSRTRTRYHNVFSSEMLSPIEAKLSELKMHKWYMVLDF